MSAGLRRSRNISFHVFLQVLIHFQDEEVKKNVENTEGKQFRGILGSNTKVSKCKLHFFDLYVCVNVYGYDYNVTLYNVIITLQKVFPAIPISFRLFLAASNATQKI